MRYFGNPSATTSIELPRGATWVLILSFSAGATLTFDTSTTIAVNGFYPPIPCPGGPGGLVPWKLLSTTGTLTLLVGEPGDRMPQGASSSASTVKLYDSNGNAIATDGATGRLIVVGPAADGGAAAGAPVLVAGKDAAGAVKTVPVVAATAAVPNTLVVCGGKDSAGNAQELPLSQTGQGINARGILAAVRDPAGNAQAVAATYERRIAVTLGEPGDAGAVQVDIAVANNGDAAVLNVSGKDWGEVSCSAVPAGNTGWFAEYTNDGTNWLQAPFGRRTDAVAANPTVKAFGPTTPVLLNVGEFWNFPIPSTAIKFRMRYAGNAAATMHMIATTRCMPGCQVVAVLYDITSAVNTANNTPTLDVTGWTQLYHHMTANGGVPAFGIAEVDDGGATLANLVTSAAAAGFAGGLGAGTTIGGAAAGLAAVAAQVPLPRRVQYTSAAIVGQTTRVRIEARR